ncbi:biotin transporter BioY [Nitratidesulfovibrio sp. SRB-5]|uniref:biotin transporter BioY n=1 Tax=Nitratidesulfovibrio sp. SRB-5 TaxID=2872636 RepID=UPI001CBD04FA|nr:biotin transporter BioY [Nitratidesulfovibrio sp. SRB-5]MBZ2172525.1 biotin transporter BioY [Nitratidesulfovibrio sp. SRB-5]
MHDAPLAGLHRLVWTALMAALIAVGAMVMLPVGPVPVTLQTLFVALAGLVLGSARGAGAMLLYVLAGVMGLPVFSGGKAGFAHLLGPTGGYLFGFACMACIAGLGGLRGLRGREARDASIGLPRVALALCCCLAGLAVAYLAGAARLMQVLDIDVARAVAVGVLPFLPGDVVKVVLAVAAWRFLAVRRLLPR